MADVFLSYSRRDSDFVRGLVADLEGRGKSVWVDTEGIADAEVFPDAIRSAIEGSDAFVFVITPESAASAYCENEVEHALLLNKRVVPVLREAVPDDRLPEAIRVRNWIPYTADVDAIAASERLVAALDTDLDYVHAHTRWLVKALEWDANDRDKSLLLRGSELALAEAWLAGAAESVEPAPTALQREYLLAGRTASARRQRILVAVSLTGLVIALVLAGFALISRSQAQTSRDQAVSARANAQSRALAAESANQLTLEPERALLLAMAAVRADRTPEAVYALRRAIDLSPIRGRLPANDIEGFTHVGTKVAYSPDGKQIAEAHTQQKDGLETGTLTFIDAKTLQVQRREHVGAETWRSAYSPDGSMFAQGTDHGAVLIDPRTGTRLRTIKAMTNAIGIQFSPDGALLAATEEDPITYDGHLEVFDLRTNRLRVIPTGSFGRYPGATQHGLNAVGFSPDGKRLAVGAFGGLGVFDLASGRLLATTLAGHNVNQAKYSPDGSSILAAFAPDGTNNLKTYGAGLFDAQTLKPTESVFDTDAYNRLSSVAFSPDGSRVAFTAYSTFGVYSLKAHHLVYKSTFGTAGLTGSAFSPDGRHLVVVSADGGGAVYRATGAEQSVIDAGPIDSEIVELPLALTRDGVVATFSPAEGGNAHRPVVRTWSWNGKSTAPPLVLAPDNCPFFGVAPVGTVAFVATADCGQLGDKVTSPQPVWVWDIGKRKVVKTLTATAAGEGDFPEISRDGSWILELVPQKANPRQPVLDVINVKTGITTLINDHCVGGLRGPAIADDGSQVVVPCGSNLLGWRMTTKPPAAHRLAAGFVAQPQGRLSFSPDGTRVAVANMNGEGQVGILDAETGKTLVMLAGHTDRVPRVVWSPDGKLFLTAGRDGTARVWDPTSGRLLRTLDHPAPVFGAAFSPDSRTVATMDANGTIRLWDACTDCENPDALMALAKTRVTRGLTASEKATYLG